MAPSLQSALVPLVTADKLSDLRATRPASRIGGAARWLVAPLRPFLVVLMPDRHVAREVIAHRYGWPLLTAVMCACVAAFALGSRLDVGPAVHADNAGVTVNAGSKPPEIKTDHEIDEEIAQRTSVARVKLGLGAMFGTPFRVLALGLALLLLGRFIGGKPTMPRTVTVAALAAIPGAVRSLVTALVAWHEPRVFPDDLDGLVRSPQLIPDGNPILARLFAGVDVFTWWSVVVVAFGLCAAADVKPRKGIVAFAIGFALYLVVTRLIMGGAGR